MITGIDGLTPDDRTVWLLRVSCSSKRAAGCARLGQLTAQGIGTDADPELAAEFFERGCAHGDSKACRSLGDTLSGAGGSSQRRAVELFVGACVAGDSEACRRIPVRIASQSDLPAEKKLASTR
jgi:TPR repeat protein